MIDYKTTLLSEIEILCNRIEQESYEKGYIKGKEAKISEDEVYEQYLSTLAERTQLYYQAGLKDGLEGVKKTAYWIDTGSGEQCSNCKEIQYGYDNFRNYCAYCGSKMIDAKKDRVL